MEKIHTTCQICARQIKVTASGLIAHHGYKRPHVGWQTDSCLGARHLPYEQSRAYIPEVIEQIEKYIGNQKTHLDWFLSNPPEQLTEIIDSSFGSGKSIFHLKPEGFDPKNIGYCGVRGYAREFNSQKREMEYSIRVAQDDVAFLRRRYAEWVVPQEVVAK